MLKEVEGPALQKHFSQSMHRASKLAHRELQAGKPTSRGPAHRPGEAVTGLQGACAVRLREAVPSRDPALLSHDLSLRGGDLRPKWRPTCSGGASFSSTRSW